MLGEAPLAQTFSRKLFDAGVFGMAIGFPTVPSGKARIRVMISAAHSRDDLDQGLEAFAKVGRELAVIEYKDAPAGLGKYRFEGLINIICFPVIPLWSLCSQMLISANLHMHNYLSERLLA